MRRTDQEFKEEVLRRSTAYRTEQKQMRKKVFTTALCFALAIFGIRLVMPMLAMGGSTEAVANDGINMEAPQELTADAFYVDKSMAKPEAAEEEQHVFGSTMAPGSAKEESQGIPKDFAIRFVWGVTVEANYPEDFPIGFVWGVMANNIFDTEKGEIQKDLVAAGTATAEFEPTDELLYQIYDMINELDVLSIEREMSGAALREEYPEVDGGMKPLTTFEFRITMNGETYWITGDENAAYFHDDEEAVRFMDFAYFMIQLVQDMPEYQSLPDAVGGYQ